MSYVKEIYSEKDVLDNVMNVKELYMCGIIPKDNAIDSLSKSCSKLGGDSKHKVIRLIQYIEKEF